MQTQLYQIITDFRNEMNQRFDDVECKFVSTDRFKPVEMIVYGMAGFILITVLGAIIGIVIIKASPTLAGGIRTVADPTVQAIGNTLSSVKIN